MTSRKSSGGFTLIELMAVVVIVAVLTMVAYPAYQSFVIKANRAEAKSHLMKLAHRQQLYFNDARAYADEAQLNVTEPARVANNYAVAFDLSTISPEPRFTITAVPKAGTQQRDDGALSINNRGEKLHAGEPW